MRALSISALLIFLLQATPTAAQEAGKTIEFKKGQAVDILFLEPKPDNDEKLKEYFSTVFPLIKDAGYQPRPGFRITQNPTQGNYHPSVLTFASWRNAESRAQAMANIDENVPDFHKRRMDIWSSFAMTVYEMEEDLSFTVDGEGTYVLTAYWRQEGAGGDRSFRAFKKAWLEKLKARGGELTLELEDGSSPFGYRYDPDYLTLTRWSSQEAFEAFHRQNLEMDHRGVGHVNQFILDSAPSKK